MRQKTIAEEKMVCYLLKIGEIPRILSKRKIWAWINGPAVKSTYVVEN